MIIPQSSWNSLLDLDEEGHKGTRLELPEVCSDAGLASSPIFLDQFFYSLLPEAKTGTM